MNDVYPTKIGRRARKHQAEPAARTVSLSSLECSLMREALLLLIDSRRRALELTAQMCRQRRLAAPCVQDFHIPVVLRLLREFSDGEPPGGGGGDAREPHNGGRDAR
ncbi:hypothetical protein [Burkholderia plantarii]|uniref:hypothetical protein n=1 Tax=Burkholderia plantarii TaxID=41899 RepID=UPI0018DE8784|nr:hypothetical protein [Burkholderia plantarii]MBI0331415.1 hypothetical protein [Burkholderia plantarii]